MVIQSESSDPIMTYCCASSKNCCFFNYHRLSGSF